jgi:hypothetical protein
MERRRSLARSLRDRPDSGNPSTETSPLVGSSRLPAIVSSVLLPDPLGPMTATSSPPSTDRSIARSASTSLGPEPYLFHTLRSSTAAVISTPPLG